MRIDERKLPALFIMIVIIISLMIAFLNNFIPGEIIYIKDENKTSCDRITNSYYEDVDKNSESPILIPYNKNDIHDIIYIVGNIELGDNLNDGNLIQLNNDLIYTVTLKNKVKKDLSLNIWNNTNTIKNIKINFNNKKDKFITLKQQKVINLQSNGNSWNLINISDIKDNKDLIQKQILNKVKNIIKINKLSIESELESLEKKFISQFNEDISTYKKLIELKFREMENTIIIKTAFTNLTKLETLIYNKLKYNDKIKINSDEYNEFTDLFNSELIKFKMEINSIKSSLKNDIIALMYTENNHFKDRISFLLKYNKEEILSEINSKINNTIQDQISFILNKLIDSINPNLDDKVKKQLLNMKESLGTLIQNKLNEYEIFVKNKVDNSRSIIKLINNEIKLTIKQEVLDLQKEFQFQITIMKDRLTFCFNNKITFIERYLSMIKDKTGDNLEKYKGDEVISSIQQLLKDIHEDISKQQEYISSQIIDQEENINSNIN